MKNKETENNFLNELGKAYKSDRKSGGENVSVTPLMVERAIMGTENADMWELTNSYPPTEDDIAEKGD